MNKFVSERLASFINDSQKAPLAAAHRWRRGGGARKTIKSSKYIKSLFPNLRHLTLEYPKKVDRLGMFAKANLDVGAKITSL